MVAEKDVVYKRFPIPLINRLEKHLLVMSTGLTEHQARLVKDLEKWVKLFSEAKHGLSLDTSRYMNYSLQLEVVFKVDIYNNHSRTRNAFDHYPYRMKITYT